MVITSQWHPAMQLTGQYFFFSSDVWSKCMYMIAMKRVRHKGSFYFPEIVWGDHLKKKKALNSTLEVGEF